MEMSLYRATQALQKKEARNCLPMPNILKCQKCYNTEIRVLSADIHMTF